ncbi:biopolymer transporter ExbD [Pseudoduganella sp. GCM10020061]|uniref:biopolymer transporter ExbD n=1 Tax=Pseudoduganella sp. GCM10020061 TaxID=3317345 RepID=UPI0036456ABB
MASSFSSSLRGGRRRKFKSEINVVPYIDVMLVLLIIFMAIPPSNSPAVINLPKAERSAQPPDDYIQVIVQPNQLSIAINGKNPRALETVDDRPALVQRLRALHDEQPELPVMISGDKDVKYDEVIQLISEAKKMGINRVGLATK